MKNFEDVLDDVRTGRRVIVKVAHECTGPGRIAVAFRDGEEVSVTASEARELLDARAAKGATSVSGRDGFFDELFDSLG